MNTVDGSRLAHEFNNLLCVVVTNLAFVATGLTSDRSDDVTEALHDAAQAATRAAELVEKLTRA